MSQQLVGVGIVFDAGENGRGPNDEGLRVSGLTPKGSAEASKSRYFLFSLGSVDQVADGSCRRTLTPRVMQATRSACTTSLRWLMGRTCGHGAQVSPPRGRVCLHGQREEEESERERVLADVVSLS